jgi:hypothetical protein
MRIVPRLARGLGALLLIFAAGAAHLAAAEGEEYFNETGHSVREPFLAYFHESGGLAAHGYPITNEFIDPTTQRLVQFFEKTRLEWHPENAAPDRVRLGRLGVDLGRQEGPLPVRQLAAPGNPNCVHTPQTGHQVCDAFLEYWRTNGGSARFGNPIGRYTLERGRLAQWFEHGRLEWHPERPAGERVRAADVGREAFAALGNDASLLDPDPPPDPSFGRVVRLHARATLLRPVTTAGSEQTIYIFVADQFGSARGGAAVFIILHYPGGEVAVQLPPTTAEGVSQTTFRVPAMAPNTQVRIEVFARYQGLMAETVGSFRVWY